MTNSQKFDIIINMRITGFQKLSLVDFDDHMSATLFTSGCNFACPFCHNSSLVIGNSDPEISEQEIFDYLQKRKGIIDSVVISGGEPTLHKDLVEFIKKLKNLDILIKLDTNGTNLEMLKYLIENKLIDYVAMDIKNSLEKYNITIDRNCDLQTIKDTIKYIMHSGIDYEFRTTIIKEFHTHEDIKNISKLIKGAKKYYLQKFEDSGSCIKSGLNPIDKNTATEYLQILQQDIPNTKLRGY